MTFNLQQLLYAPRFLFGPRLSLHVLACKRHSGLAQRAQRLIGHLTGMFTGCRVARRAVPGSADHFLRP
jgi:hypothetical protein